MEKESQNATVKTPSLVMYIIRISLKILMYSSYFFSLNQMDFIYIFIYFVHNAHFLILRGSRGLMVRELDL